MMLSWVGLTSRILSITRTATIGEPAGSKQPWLVIKAQQLLRRVNLA